MEKRKFKMKKDAGIDGILVTVGLCVIALLLCVMMRAQLTAFVDTLVGSMTSMAEEIIGGANTNTAPEEAP